MPRALGIASVLALSLAAGVVVTVTVGATSAQAGKPVAPESVIPLLGEAGESATSTVVGAAAERLGVGGLREASLRHLGSKDRADYWVAVDHAANVCLVIVLDDGTSGCACDDPADVERQGLTFGLTGNQRPGRSPASVVGVLLPESAAVKSSGSWVRVGDHLVVAEQTRLGKAPELTVLREAGRSGAAIQVRG